MLFRIVLDLTDASPVADCLFIPASYRNLEKYRLIFEIFIKAVLRRLCHIVRRLIKHRETYFSISTECRLILIIECHWIGNLMSQYASCDRETWTSVHAIMRSFMDTSLFISMRKTFQRCIKDIIIFMLSCKQTMITCKPFPFISNLLA